jgi:hypothetical protein
VFQKGSLIGSNVSIPMLTKCVVPRPWHTRYQGVIAFANTWGSARHEGEAMLQPIGSHTRYIQSVLKGTAREDGAATPD